MAEILTSLDSRRSSNKMEMKSFSYIFHGFVTLDLADVRYEIFTNLSRNLNIPGAALQLHSVCKAAFALVVQ